MVPLFYDMCLYLPFPAGVEWGGREKGTNGVALRLVCSILTKQHQVMPQSTEMFLKRWLASLHSNAFLFPAHAETIQAQWLRGAPEPAGMKECDLHPIAEVRPSTRLPFFLGIKFIIHHCV